jgi:hypothetical protein
MRVAQKKPVRRFGSEDVKVMVPAAAQGVLWGRAPLANVSMGSLFQCPWGLFLTVSTSSQRIMPERASFDQAI